MFGVIVALRVGRLSMFSFLLGLVSTIGFAQVEEWYSRNHVLEQVIINDSLRYRIEFREYPEMGKNTGLGQWKYFEFDCVERLGPVVRKVRITSGWGMRVRDEEMDSARGIKYEYTYVAPFRNLENASKKYFEKLKGLKHPSELLEIREIKEILATNQRYQTQIEYYMDDSLLVSRVQLEDGKLKQVDSARYEGGRRVYSKGEYSSAHYFRYDLDSAGSIKAIYDSTEHEKSITRYRYGQPIETANLNASGEIKERKRTTYSGDTLAIVSYYNSKGGFQGKTMRLRKWNSQMNVYSYSVDGSLLYEKHFDEMGRLIREVWKVRGGGESIRVYMYLSDK
jgi:hypothetical protein